MTHSRRPLYIGLGGLALVLCGFGLIADEVVEGETRVWDTMVLMALRQPGHPEVPIGPSWLPETVRDITSLGSTSVLVLLVTLVVTFLLLVGRRATAALLALAVIFGAATSTILKAVFNRPRPALTGIADVFTASFPSGHSVASAVTFLTVGAILFGTTTERRLRIFYLGAAVLLTALVGTSRIYLGVHYPTDVLAGWCLGAAWAILSFIVGDIFILPRARATSQGPKH